MRLAATGLILLTLVGGANPVRADEAATLRMEGWWGGLKGADLDLVVSEESGQWHGQFDIRGVGLVKLLTGLAADAEGRGRLVGADAEPSFYRQRVLSRRSDRTVELGFSGNPPTGSRISDSETYVDPKQQKRDPENVPDLPEAQRHGTMDPIAAVLTLGRRAVAGEREFTLPVYDGRRRFDLAVRVVGARHHNIAKHAYDTIDAVTIVHPVAGFKPFHQRWWNNARFDLYLDPKTGLPLQISSSSFIAAVVISTLAICPPETACELPDAR